jgi:hypothetical protein
MVYLIAASSEMWNILTAACRLMWNILMASSILVGRNTLFTGSWLMRNSYVWEYPN